ncbi:mediator of RNA polymerase II transcription subunit 1-domain-containing protein [Nemania sp. FL0916]|nr:mediator of RNA polymerase II transcription subunit 1-domain-containing protein [Nemania sp. FL0916]
MSTPMRHGPSQQGRTPSQHPAAAPTPQASTPFSNSQAATALSPHGPRSSPQQLKKSPANGTLPSVMASQSTNPPLNFDSPSAAAALGGLGLDINLDNISVGGLVGGANRSDEDDRKKRMDAVIAALWAFDTGRVSNDGLERLAVHLGLECLWETASTGPEDGKTLIIAGRTMCIEISIKNHVVHHVSLSFNEPRPSLDKHVEAASAILFQDLALGPGESQLTKKLSKFRANLERLATLDRLSITPGLSCHEAVSGVWESLEKLHRWDVEGLRQDPALSDRSEENLRVLALCSRHGCPLMHTRGCVGLTLDYWKQYHKYKTTTVDGGKWKGKTWGILVDCAPTNNMNMVYTPVRVSDTWIGPDIAKLNPTPDELMSATGPVLDWLEPPATILSSTEENKQETGMDTLSAPKSVDAVFMAAFNPPLVVTHSVAMEIYKISAFNAPLSSSTFDNLLFPVSEGANYDPSEPRVMTFMQTVPVFANTLKSQAKPLMKAHRNTLLVDKPVYGQILTHVPIPHPKDLIMMLPMLRQYAFLSLLLENSFKPREGIPLANKSIANNDETSIPTASREPRESMPKDSNQVSPAPLRVDIVLSAHPIPRLQLAFPFRDIAAMINLEIQLNGQIHIVSDNVFSDSESDASRWKCKGKYASRKDFARKLEECENIGIWVEFIKQKFE